MKLLKLAAAAALFSIFFFSACSDDGEKYEPRLEKVGNWNIVFLKGTPYEMGLQQAEVFQEGIEATYDFFFGPAAGNTNYRYEMPADNIFNKPEGEIINDAVRSIFLQGFEEARDAVFDETGKIIGTKADGVEGTNVYDIIMENASDNIVEECEGIVEGSKKYIKDTEGFGLENCVAFNSLLYLLEVNQKIGGMMSNACHGFIADSNATKNGQLIHARSLEWPGLMCFIRYPAIFVRQPEGKIPYVGIGFPGLICTHATMNAKGISAGINEVSSALDEDFPQKGGNDTTHVMNRIMEEASNLAEANAIMDESTSASSELFYIASASDDAGQIYEIAGPVVKIKPMNELGTVYVTNNYSGADMLAVSGLGYTHPGEDDLKAENDPIKSKYTSQHRYMRLQQFFGLPSHPDYLVGELDVEKAIGVQRDRKFAVVPYSIDGVEKEGVYEHGYFKRNGHILGTNSVSTSVVMEPGTGNFWVAGGIPNDLSIAEMGLIILNPIANHNVYHGFNIHDLINGKIDSGLQAYDGIPGADEEDAYYLEAANLFK